MGKCVRVKWIDYAKGITMLLVIIGHTISDDLIRGMIFSFHMPLFFMLSCVTYRFSLDKGELKSKNQKIIYAFDYSGDIYFPNMSGV